MSEQIITKTCRICKQVKSISDFYKDLAKKDGHRSCCKKCDCEHTKKYSKSNEGKTNIKKYCQTEKGKSMRRKAGRRYYQTEKGKNERINYAQSEIGKVACRRAIKKYQSRYPERRKARNAVNNAIRTSELPRPDSLQCHYGNHPAKEYHHYKGYEPKHWFDILPVCYSCHKTIA